MAVQAEFLENGCTDFRLAVVKGRQAVQNLTRVAGFLHARPVDL